jgi:hypothetical protein
MKQTGGIEGFGGVKTSNVPKAFPSRTTNYKSYKTAVPAVPVSTKPSK